MKGLLVLLLAGIGTVVVGKNIYDYTLYKQGLMLPSDYAKLHPIIRVDYSTHVSQEEEALWYVDEWEDLNRYSMYSPYFGENHVWI